ncbi:hypothetical protein [Nocardia jiangxiensis]|uniref:hypothetical protein n=1 Tax=Nocardia jiangxiensis TaxID=282685 RepID=UPI00146D596B|nr:hypothetical protein [Nocardia jiangxiensis]
MSSMAMHSGPPSYQARTGRSVEERTRAMIVAAAEQVMLARIAAPVSGVSIERLSTADVCAEARGYLRRDGSEGPIPKATMWKHFKTVEALAAAVVENITAENRPVPEPIAELAARGGRSEDTARGSVDAERLEARFSARHFDIGGLREQFAEAAAREDRPDMVFWSAELAERYLQRHRRGDRHPATTASEWARRGMSLVDPRSRLDCMMGIRCTRAAAEAEAVLSRSAEYEPTGLSRVRSIKETEAEFADALGWVLHRELARFHADHARALCEEDAEREMRSLRAIADALGELCAADAEVSREPGDTLRAGELAYVIAGLCRVETAYATHPTHRGTYAAIFADRMAETRTELLACFAVTARERHRHEDNIRALLRMDAFARRLDRIGPAAEPGEIATAVEDYEHASIDLLRTTEYGTIRDILVARYLIAKARSLTHRDAESRRSPDHTPDRPAGSLVHPQPAVLIQGAIQFYDHAATAGSSRGSTGVLRALAAAGSAELRRANPVRRKVDGDCAPADSEIDTIAQTINDLVLITVSRRNRFTDNEIEHLLAMVDPMYYYITSGRN